MSYNAQIGVGFIIGSAIGGFLGCWLTNVLWDWWEARRRR